jgi:hypothetical protein
MKKIITLSFILSLFGSFAQQQRSAQTMSAVPFTKLTLAPNVHGYEASEAVPLNYNDQVNTVTFFTRKGPGYISSPNNNDGSIVAYIGTSFGTVWDSSCVWTSTLQFGRYPQGGIVNPIGNTVTTSAALVSMGPVQSPSGSWFGNFYASKSLSVAGTPTPGADQQFISNTAPSYPVNQPRHHASRNNLSIPDDGRVRTVAGVLDDPSQPISNQKPRGIALVKGLYNAGVFAWTVDTFTPPVLTKLNGHKYLSSNGYQAWNEAGNIGYVMMIGIQASATGANRGMQPIIWKTTNSGTTWAQIPSIDFNASQFYRIINSLEQTYDGNNCTKKPCFMQNEGIACAVDNLGKLHIYATLGSSAYDTYADSLFVIRKFTQGGEKYNWAFVANHYPYIYDFYNDGISPDWQANIVDSVGTQGAGWATNELGYNDNPWDPDPANSNKKIPIGMRIQATRSADCQNIMISWAQSDTNFTSMAKKYNMLPNIAARSYYSGSGKFSEKQFFTNGTGLNPNVANRAFNHFLSPASSGTFAFGWASYTVPLVVINSNPLSQNTDNYVWYSNATRTFTNFNFSTLGTGSMCIVGLKDAQSSLESIEAYPNPAEDALYLKMNKGFSKDLKLTPSNVIGQKFPELNYSATESEALIKVNTSGLPKGLYFISIENAGEKRSLRFIKN